MFGFGKNSPSKVVPGADDEDEVVPDTDDEDEVVSNNPIIKPGVDRGRAANARAEIRTAGDDDNEDDNDEEDDDDEDDEEDEVEPAEPAAGAATESAMFTKNPNVKYDLDDSKEIVLISFHLSKKYGFQVNKDIRGTKFDKPVYPVLYKIDGHSGQPPKIGILKNKACIEKNLPADLSNYLTILNTVLLNEYTRYYDAGKFGELVEAQKSFLEGQVQEDEEQGQGGQGGQVQEQRGQGGQGGQGGQEDEEEEEEEEE